MKWKHPDGSTFRVIPLTDQAKKDLNTCVHQEALLAALKDLGYEPVDPPPPGTTLH